MKAIYYLLVSGSLAVPVQAQVWLENDQGELDLHQAQVENSCAPGETDTYLSRALPEHPNFRRLQYDGRDMVALPLARSAASLVIRPRTTEHEPDDRAGIAGWGITPAGGRVDNPGYRWFWHQPGSAQLRSAYLALQPLQWQQGWTADYRPSAVAWLPADLRPQRLADDPQHDWLLLPGDATVPLRLFQAATGEPRQLAVPAVQSSFALPPIAVDLNQDGLAERFYLLSVQGTLLQYDWAAGVGWQQSVLADLQSSGREFSGSLQHFTARWRGPAGWQQGDVFVMLARAAGQYYLFVLRRPQDANAPVDLEDVSTEPGFNNAGWQRQLPGRPVSQARVLAGILYLPLSPQQDCLEDAGYNQVLALQLFSGAPAYASAIIGAGSDLQRPLRLQRHAGEFQLWSGDTLVVPRVNTLNADCLQCVETLTPEHLQGEQAIAWFRHEQVY